MKALHYLIQCFKDKGLKKFANSAEVRLRGHLGGGERGAGSAAWPGKRRQRASGLAEDPCPLLLTAAGKQSAFSRLAFALLTVKFTFSLIITFYTPPPPVAVKFWCEKLFSGRKKKNLR